MEFSPVKMTPAAKVRKECNRCIVKILKLMVRCQKSDNISRTDRWLVVAETRELLSSLTQIPHHIGKWVHGGEMLIKSLAREYIKTIVVSTRKLRHVPRMMTSIESDIALLEKLLGNQEDVVSAVLNSASLVSEGNGLAYKSQADAFAVVISTVVKEYLKSNQLQMTNVKAWLVMLLGRLWLTCLPNDGPNRDEVHKKMLTRLPKVMKDRHQEFYRNVELMMQPFETLEEMAPIKVRPLFIGTPKSLDEELLKVIDFSGLPNKFLHFLHLCIKNMNSVFLTPIGHDNSFTILSQSSNFGFSDDLTPISSKPTENTSKASQKTKPLNTSQSPLQIDSNRAPQVTSRGFSESYPCQSSSNIYCATPRRPLRALLCTSQNTSTNLSSLMPKETKIQTLHENSPASNEISRQTPSQVPCKMPSVKSKEQGFLPQNESSQKLPCGEFLSNSKTEGLETELSSSWPLINRKKSLRISQKIKDNKSNNIYCKYSQDSKMKTNVVYLNFSKGLIKNVAESGEKELKENPELSFKVINESENETDELVKRNTELSLKIIEGNQNEISTDDNRELPLKVINRKRTETKKKHTVRVKDNPAIPDYKKGERESSDLELSLYLDNDDENPSREVTPALIKVDTSDDEHIIDNQVNERIENSTDCGHVLSLVSQQKENSKKRKFELTLCKKNSHEKDKTTFAESIVKPLSGDNAKTSKTQSHSPNANEGLVHTKSISEKNNFIDKIECVMKSNDTYSHTNYIKKHKPNEEDNLVNICPSIDHTEINHMNSEQTIKVNKIDRKSKCSFKSKDSISPCDAHICPYIQSDSGKTFSCVNKNSATVSVNQKSFTADASNGNSLSFQLEEPVHANEKDASSLRKPLEEGESVESLSIESEEEYKKKYQDKEVANKGTVSSIWNGSQLEDNRFVPRTWRRLVKGRMKRRENGKIEQRVDVLLIPPTGRHIRYPKMLKNYLKEHPSVELDQCRVFKVSPRSKKKVLTGSESFMRGSPQVKKKKFKWIKKENKEHKTKVSRENYDISHQGYCNNLMPNSDNESNLILHGSQGNKSVSKDLLDPKMTCAKISSPNEKQEVNSVYDFTDEIRETLLDGENLAVSSKSNELKASTSTNCKNEKNYEKVASTTIQTKDFLKNLEDLKSVSKYSHKNKLSSKTFCTDLKYNVTSNENFNTNEKFVKSGNCCSKDTSTTFDISGNNVSSIKHKKSKQFSEAIPGSVIASNSSIPATIYGKENSADNTTVTSPLKTPRLSNKEIINSNALKHLTSTPAHSMQNNTKKVSQPFFIKIKGKSFQDQQLDRYAEISNLGTRHESDDINSSPDICSNPVFKNVSNTCTQTLSAYNHIDSQDISGCLTVIRDSQTGSRLALLPLSEQTVGDDIRIEVSVRRYPKKPIKSAQMLNSSIFTLSPNDVVPPTLLETEGGTIVTFTPMKTCQEISSNLQHQKSSCQRNLFTEFDAQASSCAFKTGKPESEEQSNKLENNSESQTVYHSNENEVTSKNNLDDTALISANHTNNNEISPSNEFSDIYQSLTNSVKQCFLSPSNVDDPFSPIVEPTPNVSKTPASVSSKKLNNIEIDSDSQCSMSSISTLGSSESCGSSTSNASKSSTNSKYRKRSCASRTLKNLRLASHFPGLNQRLSSPSKKFQSGLCPYHCRSKKTLKNPKLCDPCCPLCVMTLDEQVLCTYHLDTSYLSGAEVDEDSPIMDFVSAKHYLYGEYSNILCTVFPSMPETSLLPEFGAPPAACRKHAVPITGASEEIIDGIPRFTTSFSDVSRDTYSLNENTSCGLSSQEFINSQLKKNIGTTQNSLNNIQKRKKCIKLRNYSSKQRRAASSTSCSDLEEISSSTKEKLKYTKRTSKSKFIHNRFNKQMEPHKSKQKTVKYKAVFSKKISSPDLCHVQSKKIDTNKLSPKVPDINNSLTVPKQHLSPKISVRNVAIRAPNVSPKVSNRNSNVNVHKQKLSPKVSDRNSNVIINTPLLLNKVSDRNVIVHAPMLSPNVSDRNSNVNVDKQKLSPNVSDRNSNFIVHTPLLSPKVSERNVIVHTPMLSPKVSDRNNNMNVHTQKLSHKVFDSSSNVIVHTQKLSPKVDVKNNYLCSKTPNTVITPDQCCNSHETNKKNYNLILKNDNGKKKKTISSQKVAVVSQEENTTQQSSRQIDKEVSTPCKESKTPKKFFKTPSKFRNNVKNNGNTYKMYKHYVISNNKAFSPLKLSFKYVSPKRESFDSFERFKRRLMSGKKKQSPGATYDERDAHLYL